MGLHCILYSFADKNYSTVSYSCTSYSGMLSVTPDCEPEMPRRLLYLAQSTAVALHAAEPLNNARIIRAFHTVLVVVAQIAKQIN